MTATAAHLTNGWEPDTPVGDTLLRRYVFNLAASNEALVAEMGGRVLRRDDLAAVDLGRPAGFFNAATLLQPLDADRTEEVVGTVEDFYGGRGSGEVLLWSAWPTPDLRRFGWELEGHPPLMIRPPAPLPPLRPTGLAVEEVTDRHGVRDWERVAVDGFPLRELQPLRPGSLVDERVLADQRLRLWVGYEAGRPVCIGTLFVDLGLAHLVLGVTLDSARRRGYWTAMARQRLLATPGLPAAAVFSDMSRPGAEALGFLPITRFTLWHRGRRARR